MIFCYSRTGNSDCIFIDSFLKIEKEGVMMRKMALFTVAVVLGLALGTCTLRAPKPPATASFTVTEKDVGATIEMNSADELVVALQGNPGTGYAWEVLPADVAVLEQVGEWEFEPQSNLAGAPGTMTLRFRAVEAGQQVLQLVYRRPWETDVPPLDTFEVTVIVNQ
jgi:inhibitor of cysteine peptidase